MTNNLIRGENNPKALLNTDLKSLEEYKFKKRLLSDINKLNKALESVVETNNALQDRIAELENRLETLETSKGKE